MPFDLAISPKNVKSRLPSAGTIGLKDHALICLYLVLLDVKLAGLYTPPHAVALDHLEYAKTLPRPSQIETALWFSQAEFDLLRGSNLHPAVIERRREWKEEFSAFDRTHLDAVALDGALFTWDRYLWASSILSTRAFGSYLLDGDKSNATQVLLPGIDVFNHRRGAAVTWFSNYKERQMQLLIDESIQKGAGARLH